MAIFDIRIRIFKAIDDLASCERFMEGHTNVLKIYGVTQVTSARKDWFNNPDAYVIVAESIDTDEMVGGIRAHIANDTHPLPLEEAIEEKEPSVKDFVKSLAVDGTGEICGLWNSRTVKGMGISVILMRTVIAILPQLNLKTFLGLCAPHTFDQLQKLGYAPIKSLGNNGTFYYPKEDLVATAIMIQDTEKLPTSDPFDKSIVMDLRQNLVQKKTEKGPLGEINIDYNLKINVKKELTL